MLRQDLQEIQERTAVESRVSDLEDKLPPLAREAHVAHQLVQETNTRAEDMENRLCHNNICIMGMLERWKVGIPRTL